MPMDEQGTRPEDPIDELVDSYGDATESLDENTPSRSMEDNSQEIKYPENDALDMDMKRKSRIAKMMMKMK